MENLFARPKFQWFDKALPVSSPEDALDMLAGITEPVLVIETLDTEDILPGNGLTSSSSPSFQVITDRAGRYRILVDSPKGGWFFIADAMYPGWEAYLDGAPTQLYPAQVLGKAVFVPGGTHELKLAFRPTSFKIGLYITAFSLLVLLSTFALTRSGKQQAEPKHRNQQHL